jgi:hypothetical protein
MHYGIAASLGYSFPAMKNGEPMAMHRLLTGLLVIAFMAPEASWASDVTTAPPLDFSRVGWKKIDLRVSKFFITIISEAQLELLPGNTPDLNLLDADHGVAVMPGDSVLRLNTHTQFLGRDSFIQLLMDPGTAAAIQYEVHDQGKRYRHRFFRFTDIGTLVKTHRPAEDNFDAEKDRPWQDWSSVEQGFRAYPAEARGLLVTDPLAIIYIAAAANLVPGDPPLELFTLSGDSITRIFLNPRERVRREASFSMNTAQGAVDCKGDMEVLRLELSAAPLQPGAEFELEFLGLEDDIQLFVETTTRLPVEVSGRAKWVGKARIRLREATLNAPVTCPARG